MNHDRLPRGSRSADNNKRTIEDGQRSISGEISIIGISKSNLPEQFAKKYKECNKDADSRDKYRFVVECITLFLVFFVACFGFVQTKASMKSANAAKDAADIASASLHVAERAYLSVGFTSINTDTKVLHFTVSNNGHIPTGPGNIEIYHVTYKDGFVTECQRISEGMDTVVQGSPNGQDVTFRFLDKELWDSGKQKIIAAGTISYNDGFDNTPLRSTDFCYESVRRPGTTGDPSMYNCYPKDILTKIKALGNSCVQVARAPTEMKTAQP